MDATKSKILCPVSPLVIKSILSGPIEFTQNSKEYNEETLIQYFTMSTIEHKQPFFKICFKPDVQLQSQPFLVDANLFNKETRCVITLMSKFLGLDIDKYITKPLISMLFTLNTCQVEYEESS